MRKLLFLLILFAASNSFAQISQSSVDSAKNYVTARFVNLYLADYVAHKHSIKIKGKTVTDFDSEKVKKYNSIKERLDANSIESPISIEALATMLGEEFKSTTANFVYKINTRVNLNNSPDEVANELIENIFSAAKDAFSSVPKSAADLKSTFVTDVSNFLSKKVSAKSAPSPTGTGSMSPTDTSKKAIVPVATDNSKKENFDMLTFIPAGVVLLILLVVFLLLNSKIKFQEKRVDYLDEKARGSGPKKDNFLTYSQIENINKIESLESTIASLRSEIEDLKRGVAQSTHVINKPIAPQTGYQEQRKEVQQQASYNTQSTNSAKNNPINQNSNSFYMGTPIEDFFSKNSKSTEYKKGSAFYRFIPNYNQTEAKFEFISDDETIKFIQNNSLEVVRPACKFENQPSSGTKTVVTTEQGLARLVDDNWKIIERAKIKFE